MNQDSKSPSPVMRFRTLGGAIVVVELANPPNAFRWRCLGCDDAGSRPSKSGIREDANTHAGACRAMPKEDRHEPVQRPQA